MWWFAGSIELLGTGVFNHQMKFIRSEKWDQSIKLILEGYQPITANIAIICEHLFSIQLVITINKKFNIPLLFVKLGVCCSSTLIGIILWSNSFRTRQLRLKNFSKPMFVRSRYSCTDININQFVYFRGVSLSTNLSFFQRLSILAIQKLWQPSCCAQLSWDHSLAAGKAVLRCHYWGAELWYGWRGCSFKWLLASVSSDICSAIPHHLVWKGTSFTPRLQEQTFHWKTMSITNKNYEIPQEKLEADVVLRIAVVGLCRSFHSNQNNYNQLIAPDYCN